jgi:hypothetical protein
MVQNLNARRCARMTGVACETILCLSVSTGTVHAQSVPANPTFGVLTPINLDPYHELETKYLFGFTEGADIGAQGEQSVEFESTTAFVKRGGQYATLEQEVEYENVPDHEIAQFGGETAEIDAMRIGQSIDTLDRKGHRMCTEFVTEVLRGQGDRARYSG